MFGPTTYEHQTIWALRVELARRQPELFIDVMVMTRETSREMLVLTLSLHDLDRATRANLKRRREEGQGNWDAT